MPVRSRFVLLVALLAVVAAPAARAEKKTVCTITVNSPEEKETFRRNLPDDYQFVELVEHGRADWFAAACRKGVRCDVLLISGHFDDGTEFYSDRLGARESLPVEELERASCSESCPGLFSQLKEVYLFGCNTLEGAPLRTASAEIARSLVRSGHSPEDAERLSRELSETHGESNRDRMRHIFKDVPVIYGFSSKAPLGHAAGPVLERYFQSSATGEIGSGRANAKLLGLFAASSMIATGGLRDSDADAGVRRDACQLADDRLSSAQKVEFVHRLMRGEIAAVRMLLDRIEHYVASLSDAERQTPAVSQALDELASDREARKRYLEFARDADQPAVRARLIVLAGSLGWLSPEEERTELVRMFGDRLAAGGVGISDVDLACALGNKHELDQERERLLPSSVSIGKAAHAAVLACLGSTEARARVVRALASPREDDVRIAQTYLHHRPIGDAAELRELAAAVLRMSGSDAQVRALETLAAYRLSDKEILEDLTHLFSLAKSIDVQRAIAGILIRSDYRTIASPDLVRALRQHRLKSPDGADVIDALLRRMLVS
jgi:hypothetical protein